MGDLPGVTAVDADSVGHGDAPAPTAMMATAAVRRSSPPYFWPLDRVNQHDLPFDGITSSPACYPARGAGVLVLVADRGIAAGHTEFGSRAIAVPGPGSPYRSDNDGDGHGTHATSIAVGVTATLMTVKILDAHDTGTGADLIATLALDYAAALKDRDVLSSKKRLRCNELSGLKSRTRKHPGLELWCFSKLCHVRGSERLTMTIPQHPL